MCATIIRGFERPSGVQPRSNFRSAKIIIMPTINEADENMNEVEETISAEAEMPATPTLQAPFYGPRKTTPFPASWATIPVLCSIPETEDESKETSTGPAEERPLTPPPQDIIWGPRKTPGFSSSWPIIIDVMPEIQETNETELEETDTSQERKIEESRQKLCEARRQLRNRHGVSVHVENEPEEAIPNPGYRCRHPIIRKRIGMIKKMCLAPHIQSPLENYRLSELSKTKTTPLPEPRPESLGSELLEAMKTLISEAESSESQPTPRPRPINCTSENPIIILRFLSQDQHPKIRSPVVEYGVSSLVPCLQNQYTASVSVTMTSSSTWDPRAAPTGLSEPVVLKFEAKSTCSYQALHDAHSLMLDEVNRKIEQYEGEEAKERRREEERKRGIALQLNRQAERVAWQKIFMRRRMEVEYGANWKKILEKRLIALEHL